MRTTLLKFGTFLVKEPLIFSNFREYDIPRLRSCLRKPAAYSTVELPNNNITLSSSDHDWKKKIIYNEVIHSERKIERIRMRNEKITYIKELGKPNTQPNVTPLFLQCMNDNSAEEEEKIEDSSSAETAVHFPYQVQKNVLIDSNISEEVLEADNSGAEFQKRVEFDTQLGRIPKGKIEYENPEEWDDIEAKELLAHDPRFGSSDPNIPVSNVPCGGCGALLHCQNTAIPGFLPKEIFEDLSEADLRGITCQRCLFLQEYNVALGINVNPDEYPKILSQIKKQKALVILMVDMLDFPCSVWPNILDIIGKKRPVFVVGNKLDLIIQEEDFLKHRKKCLLKGLEDVGISSANIIDVALISAKTGYGVEKLITKLQNIWGTKGDIYIAGCTNAGKSTLFNALIQSDMCQIRATDILQRATVSQWPGTTLNLLKFPLLTPLSWRKAVRSQRLKVAERQVKALRELKDSVLGKSDKDRQVTLMGYIGRSFGSVESSGLIGLDPNDPNFRRSKWCYDTPGVIHNSQILNLFTTEELSKVLPQKTIVPRNFKLVPGNALFIGGVARLDLIASHSHVWFTVFASPELPVTVTYIEDADFLYQKLLGTNLFAVPDGKKERLKKWPELMSKDITLVGMQKDVASADVVLSSAGWIAVTVDTARSCELRAWTPDRRGIFVRDPPLVRYSSKYRGSKIVGTPAYYPKIEIVENFENLD